MPEYVYWYADIWGWDSSPGASTSDLQRELEVGRKAMAMERCENATPELWFLALAHTTEGA